MEATSLNNEDMPAERLNLVRAALEIQTATSAEQISKILALEPGAQIIALEAIMQKVADTASTLTLTHSRFYEPLGETLSHETYVLPPELASIHERLSNHLSSNNTNEHLPYSGLIMNGIPGTGKTEYLRFLNGETAEHTTFVIANINQIRAHANPGDALFQLYRSLDRLALKTGKYVVLLLDECDKLLNPNSQTSTSELSSTKETRDGTQSATKSKKQTVIIDETGQALLSTLKTVLSGTGSIKRVFTIATTNLKTVPEEVLRGGRLEPKELLPLSLGWDNGRVTDDSINGVPWQITNYASYAVSIPRIVNVMQATHTRLHGKNCPALSNLMEEMRQYYEGDEFQTSTATLKGELKRRERFQTQFDILRKHLEILRVDKSDAVKKKRNDFCRSETAYMTPECIECMRLPAAMPRRGTRCIKKRLKTTRVPGKR